MTSLLSYVSASGQSYPLDGSDGIQCVNLIEGLTTIPSDLLIDQRVAADGGTLSNERRGPRRLILDFMIADYDKGDVLVRWGALQSDLAAGGKLVYAGPAGNRELREVTLESTIRDVAGPNDDDVFSTSLIALDPYWYGAIEQVPISIAAATAWDAAVAWNANLPWNGGGSVSLDIQGDVPAFPIFVAHGSLTTMTVALGGDETVFWIIDTAIPNSGSLSVISVDHRPGYRGPRYGTDLVPGYSRGGVNWALISEASRVTWPLPLGRAEVIVGVTGDDGQTYLTMFYEPRFLSP